AGLGEMSNSFLVVAEVERILSRLVFGFEVSERREREEKQDAGDRIPETGDAGAAPNPVSGLRHPVFLIRSDCRARRRSCPRYSRRPLRPRYFSAIPACAQRAIPWAHASRSPH